jgi:PBP1b-binding outer membrane lipoprotein LpoB
MKTINSITALLFIAVIFSGCEGDHSAQNVKDTVQNTYRVTPDSSVLYTGSAQSPENSANGGIYLVKRTPQAQRDSAQMAIK